MNIADFFSLHSQSHSLTLIGPLFSKHIEVVEPLVFVDGGTSFRKKNEGFSVGDGDSAPITLDQTLSPNKDYSDLAYVLQHIPENFVQLNLLGFLGGRRDHELINFAELHQFLVNKEGCSANFENQVIAYSRGKWLLEHNGVFSLFSFCENTVQLKGDCKYPLVDKSLRKLSSHGLSNVAKGTIEVENSSPLFVFLNHSKF